MPKQILFISDISVLYAYEIYMRRVHTRSQILDEEVNRNNIILQHFCGVFMYSVLRVVYRAISMFVTIFF